MKVHELIDLLDRYSPQTEVLVERANGNWEEPYIYVSRCGKITIVL